MPFSQRTVTFRLGDMVKDQLQPKSMKEHTIQYP